MKRFFWCFMVCLGYTGQVAAQNADSLAVAKVVDSLIGVATKLTIDKQKFDDALLINEQSQHLSVSKFGRESPQFGKCIHNLGVIYFYKGDYIQTEKYWIESKNIRERTVGKKHFDYAQSVDNLAVLYWIMGNYGKAELLYLESNALLETLVGKDNFEYAKGLNNLAGLYFSTGRYEKAEMLYIESQIIREKKLGKKHPEVLNGLNNLATLYMYLGNYESAETLYLEAKTLQEKGSDKEHPDYAVCLDNLGVLYFKMGNYEKAERLFIESKSINEKAVGKEHSAYATNLNNLAALYLDSGKLENAKHCYLESKAIREKVLGSEHPDYASSLSNLASLYSKLGDYEHAEAIWLQSKGIREKTIGKRHPDYANNLLNLAILHRETSRYDQSEKENLEAKGILEEVLGKENDEYAISLLHLYLLNLATSNFSEAKVYLLSANSIYLSLLLKSNRHLSEREISSYRKKNSVILDQCFSFNHTQPDFSPTCYDNALFLKGFLQNAAIRVNHPILPDSATTEQYYLFKSLHRRLAAEYAKPIAERKNVEELENRANDLEKELARKIAGYGEAMRQVKWQEVQAALKPSEAAIEFVHYQYWDKKETDSTLYAALVLRPGMAQPLFVPLFEEKQLEALLALKGQTPDLFYKNLYSWEGKGQTLRQLVWQPLEAALSGAKTVYFAPSGLLHRLNMGAIPSGAKATVGDQYRLVGLNSTRNVGRVSNPADVTNVTTATATLFGGIQYDMDSTAVLREQTVSPEKTNTLRSQLDFSQSDSTLRGGAWRYLPGSEKEVAELEKIMASAGIKAQVFKGFSGSEARFKAMSQPSPRILHLATHGFFFPDPKAAPAKTGPDDQVVFKSSDHPLMRSGLVLAGGNYAWQTGKSLKSGVEDGILTAYEISQIDLSQTELVVLSACETGLGDIKGSEGIYGLQRAFKIAGAKRVLISLWQVPDQQTSRLMGLFYKNWLSDKMPVGDALRAAQNTLRERGYDPFYWAGFVLVE